MKKNFQTEFKEEFFKDFDLKELLIEMFRASNLMQSVKAKDLTKALNIVSNEVKDVMTIKTDFNQMESIFDESIELSRVIFPPISEKEYIGKIDKILFSKERMKKSLIKMVEEMTAPMEDHFKNIFSLDGVEFLNKEFEKSLKDELRSIDVKELVQELKLKIIEYIKNYAKNKIKSTVRLPTNSISQNVLELFYQNFKETENNGYDCYFESNHSWMKANIEHELFKDDKVFKHNQLGEYVSKELGAQGIKHIFAFLIAMDENYNGLDFKILVKDHFERLGYKLLKNGSYDPQHKEYFIKFLRFIDGVRFMIIPKDDNKKKKRKSEINRLFVISRISCERLDDLSLRDEILIQPTRWILESLGYEKQAPQFTRILSSIAGENAKKHEETILLVPQLSRLFRIELTKIKKLKIETILRMIGHSDKHGHIRRKIDRLKSEFDYMAKQGYIKNWTCQDKIIGFNSVIEFYAPDWLFEINSKIAENKKEILKIKTPNPKKEIIEIEELKEIISRSGLSNNQFSEKVGISKGQLSKILSGGKPISINFSDKILEIYPR